MSINTPRDPRYRADCIEFFLDPQDNDSIKFDMPMEVCQAIEKAAERAGKTFNGQLYYVLDVCAYGKPTDPDDQRTIQDWQHLLGQMLLQFNPGEPWVLGSVFCRQLTGKQGSA